MSFEEYIKMLFCQFLWKELNLNSYDSDFKEYDEIILKKNSQYLELGPAINMDLFQSDEVSVLKEHYLHKSCVIDENLYPIFSKYLKRLLLSNQEYDKYYFKITEGDVDPNNIVDKDTLVFIIHIKVVPNQDFNLFLKNCNSLEKVCYKVESSIFQQKYIKVRILNHLIEDELDV